MSSSLGAATSTSSLWNNPQLLGALLPGYNIQALDQAMQAEINVTAIPLADMSQQLSGLQGQVGAWKGLQSDLSNLLTDAQSLSGTSLYQGVAASSTNTAAVTAIGTGSGTPGTFKVAVTSLMQTEIDNSALQSSDTTALGDTGSFTINGTSVSVHSTDTLQTLAASINSAGAGVTATVLPSGSSFVLNIASTDGTAITWGDPNAILQGLGVLNSGSTPAHQIQAAAQAQYTINGVAEQSATNGDTTSIPGVSLNFLSATPSGQPAYVTVTQNQTAITGAFQKLATDYNALLGDLNRYAGKGGLLEGNASVLGIAGELQQVLTQVNTAQPDGYQSLAQLGVTISAPVGSPDQLSMAVNTDSLQKALNGNAADVALLMNGASTGVARQLVAQLNALVGPTGSVTGQVTDLQSQISTLGTEINDPTSSVNMRINEQQQALEAEFQNMITALMASQAQGQQISGFLQAQYGSTYTQNGGTSHG